MKTLYLVVRNSDVYSIIMNKTIISSLVNVFRDYSSPIYINKLIEATDNKEILAYKYLVYLLERGKIGNYHRYNDSLIMQTDIDSAEYTKTHIRNVIFGVYSIIEITIPYISDYTFYSGNRIIIDEIYDMIYKNLSDIVKYYKESGLTAKPEVLETINDYINYYYKDIKLWNGEIDPSRDIYFNGIIKAVDIDIVG